MTYKVNCKENDQIKCSSFSHGKSFVAHMLNRLIKQTLSRNIKGTHYAVCLFFLNKNVQQGSALVEIPHEPTVHNYHILSITLLPAKFSELL